MKIDIDQLNESELKDLNHRIVQRLRFLQQMRVHASYARILPRRTGLFSA
jgi:hypothetical protein